MTTICNECNISFKIKDKNKPNRFCSKKCYNLNRTKHKKHSYKYTKTYKCEYCNKLFESTHSKKFCSSKCRAQSTINNKSAICEYCNSNFILIPQNKTQRFCSRKCYWNYRNDNPDIIIQTNQHKNLIKSYCKHCNKEYKIYPYRKHTSEFCSNICKHEYGRYIKTCPTCKQSFSSPKHIDKVYCSIECAAKGNNKRRSKFSNQVGKILASHYTNVEPEQLIKDSTRSVWADYVIDNKLVIECYGDYWHCNPNKYDKSYFHTKIRKTAEEIWEYDNQRIKFIQTMGYICIFIWESELKEPKFKQTLLTKIQRYL